MVSTVAPAPAGSRPANHGGGRPAPAPPGRRGRGRCRPASPAARAASRAACASRQAPLAAARRRRGPGAGVDAAAEHRRRLDQVARARRVRARASPAAASRGTICPTRSGSAGPGRGRKPASGGVEVAVERQHDAHVVPAPGQRPGQAGHGVRQAADLQPAAHTRRSPSGCACFRLRPGQSAAQRAPPPRSGSTALIA